MMTASGAPGSSRLPWSDNEELLRLLVMGTGVEAPSREYILTAIDTIEEDQLLELESLGIDVLSVRGQSAVVRGALTAFSEISGEGLAWIKSVLPHLEVVRSEGPRFYAIEMEDVFSACNLEQLQSLEAGDGLLIGVIDTGFTGYLKDLLGADRVHYVTVAYRTDSGVVSGRLVEGRNEDDDGIHGTLCAEAIAAIAPEAEFILFSSATAIDDLITMELIAEGGEIVVDGRRIKLSDIDVISNSTGAKIPFDHNDGTGELPQLADKVVAAGIPYVYALGNSGQGENTDSAYYASVFKDNDGNLYHDFDPLEDSPNDKNSLSITLDPWEGGGQALVEVILEWDGWPYQLRAASSLDWTPEEIARIQDIDLFVYYVNPDTGEPELLTKAENNQFRSLYRSDPLYPVAPLEVVQFTADEPGTYLLIAANITSLHPNNLKTRAVDLHMYVYSSGASFSIEHHTTAGALSNIGGAKDVLSVGAMGFATTGSWCLMPYSSRGPTTDGRMKPEIVAPTGYLSAFEDAPFGGTSASTPIVAAIVALLRGAVPAATPQMLREALRQTAQHLPGVCNRVGAGWGMVDAWAAYLYLKNATD